MISPFIARFNVYAIGSALLTAGVLGHYFATYQQFYPSIVAFTQSRVFNVLLVNTFVLVLILCGQILRRIFLGKLREHEKERAVELGTLHAVELLVALTVFRTPVKQMQAASLALALFWRVFHWIAAARLDHAIDETPEYTTKGSLVLYGVLLMMLQFIDFQCAQALLSHLALKGGADVLSLVLRDCVAMGIMATTQIFRILIHARDRWHGLRWEGRGAAKFYLEIASDLALCCVNIAFFVVVWTHTAFFPLNLVRESYMTLRSLGRTVVNFMNYRRLAANLDARFPDATQEEIDADSQCSICFDDMRVGEAKKLPCGHIFLRWCLRQWLERHTTCPYCRQSVETPNAANAAAAAAQQRAANPAVGEQQAQVAQQPQPQQQQQQQQPASPGSGQLLGAAAPEQTAAGQTTTPAIADDDAAIGRLYADYLVEFERRQSSGLSQSTASPAAGAPAAPPPSLLTPAAGPGQVTWQPPEWAQIVAHNPTVEEVEVYVDFHRDMHRAYSELHKKLVAARQPNTF